ncbi:gp436 family protein [Methylobacter sp. S3L5C]|uniref:gp436 family protein n=1 Tax=Methylobacter sp. S3L5C TaxID=2839024 RepID=UPI001FAC2A29|nr:DUF1320 domain-containing protein [Methylobacter sp. S3L5C]UOA07623.1 DUF1320 domain-containing protein [Methylobacter sp. S3L5C]
MTYCTQQDLINRYGEREIIHLTDRDNVGTINTTVLDQAIGDATAEINGYLVAYLPLTNIPANLVRIACDITRYYLYEDQKIEKVEFLYSQAIAYLKLVGQGKVAIAPDIAGIADAVTTQSASFTSSASLFGRESGY